MDLVREFLSRSLTAAGGVVEETGGGIEALLPGPETARLGLPEEVRINLEAPAAEDGAAIDGRLGSPLLERMVAARLATCPLATVALPAQLPRSLPEGLPVLLNAVRDGAVESVRTPARYLTADLRVILHSDELRSTLESVALRLEDGARVTPFNLAAAYPVATAPLDERERGAAGEAFRLWLHREGPRVLASALETLRRRARRDLERMAEFYASLDADMARAAERARGEEERARRVAKRAALPAELAARRGQLRERVRARLTARMVAATLVETEVERFAIAIRRRVLAGRVHVLCRAADGKFEGPGCALCGTATLRFYLCDQRLHVLCETCGHAGRLDPARCPACGRGRPEPLVCAVEDPTTQLRLGS